jgi:hypothetical protein
MDQYSPDTPEVLRFAPRQVRRDEGDPVDNAGRALVAMLQEAANIAKENVERAMTMAHKLSLQLRAAEDRSSELQAEMKRLENRALRAEQWLETIKKEIEDKLIGPMESNRRESPAPH